MANDAKSLLDWNDRRELQLWGAYRTGLWRGKGVVRRKPRRRTGNGGSKFEGRHEEHAERLGIPRASSSVCCTLFGVRRRRLSSPLRTDRGLHGGLGSDVREIHRLVFGQNDAHQSDEADRPPR